MFPKYSFRRQFPLLRFFSLLPRGELVFEERHATLRMSAMCLRWLLRYERGAITFFSCRLNERNWVDCGETGELISSGTLAKNARTIVTTSIGARRAIVTPPGDLMKRGRSGSTSRLKVNCGPNLKISRGRKKRRPWEIISRKRNKKSSNFDYELPFSREK